jgi:hypothetical protein
VLINGWKRRRLLRKAGRPATHALPQAAARTDAKADARADTE